MNLSICKRICNECPFTHASPEGWLGPHSLDDVLITQIERRFFSCHMLRKEEMDKQDIELGAVKICRGYIASSTKSGIEFGDKTEDEKALRELQIMVAAEAQEDLDTILSDKEFIIHHGPETPKNKLPEDIILKRMGFRS